LSPPVEHPKDLRGIDPCDFLTAEQKAELSLTGPEERDMSPWGEEKCFLQGFGRHHWVFAEHQAR
jgi:hypothetical protein